MEKSYHTQDFHHTYLKTIRSIPLLSKEEEFTLAKKWRDQGDKEAVEQLIGSHLRLVHKIAGGYRGYGLPLNDLVAEGHVGIMQALRHFDPEKGFRFATYAMWWIKASMQEYVLGSWSLVKIGTTASQKKLFFKLRQLKNKLGVQKLSKEDAVTIARHLDVQESDVKMMEERLSGGDHSLNTPIKESGEGEREWIEWVADTRESPEHHVLYLDELTKKKALLEKSFQALNDRERHILHDRRLHEPPFTLDELSQKYNISRERIRQIEMNAFHKLQKAIKFHAFGTKT